MFKIFVIARREYQAMVATKAFILSLVLMPFFMFGAIAIQTYMARHADTSPKTMVILDGTGKLYGPLEKLAHERNEHQLFDKKDAAQVRSPILLEKGPPPPWNDDLRMALSDRIRRNEIYAFAEIDRAAVLLPSTSGPLSNPPLVRIYTQAVGYSDVTQWFIDSLNKLASSSRIEQAKLDPRLVTAVMAPLNVQNLAPFSRSSSGKIQKASSADRSVIFFIPMGIMMLMFLSLMLVTQPMLTSIIEEKQQRIAEVLLGSVSPFQIMMGKLIGIVAVGLTFVAIYAAGGYLVAQHYGYAQLIPLNLLIWFIPFEMLACLLFGSIFIAVGAACTEIKDAQSLLMPVMLVLVMPMMIWNVAVTEPLGHLATWLSMIPPATPMLMMLRMAATPMVPMWQPMLGMVLVLITAMIAVFAAGRVLRIGLLMQGKAPRWHELVRWIGRG
ncbi:MAG TPA: ABC transporter permease [Tepidisphaeraceae bacterium]|jgi:ABC-type Na+ efflux pump permease subunit